MSDRARRGRLRQQIALLTILAIVGTLTGCGRYGRPKRPVPAPAADAAVAPVALPIG